VRGTEEQQNIQKAINKMAIVCPYLSVITLNINGLNSPNKRHRMPNTNKKNYPTMCYL